MNSEEIENASWLCNGSALFEDGCKGGMTDFGLHPELNAWRCFNNPVSGGDSIDQGLRNNNGEDECDFDMCEMCLRWALHCEKTKNSDFLHV